MPNVLLAGQWSLKKINSTVADDIWPVVLLFTLISVVVTTVTKLTVHKLVISSTLLTVLGTVLGLVISFRTSSAYERYQDGRKLWTNIAIAARNLGQLIWIHVDTDRIKPSDPLANDPAKVRTEKIKAVVEKRSMVNLIQAFAVSIKHLLRSEPGVYYEDLYPLISFLPRHSFHSSSTTDPTDHDTLPMWLDHERLTQSARSSPINTPASTISHAKSKSKSKHSTKSRNNSFDPEKSLPHVKCQIPLKPAKCPPKLTVYDYAPFLIVFRPFILGAKWLFRCCRRDKSYNLDEEMGGRSLTGKKITPPQIDSNIPLEITLVLHSYLAFVLKNSYVAPAIATGLVGNLGMLQDTVNNLERVRNTPIPFAYQAHLRMSLWLYLAFLPFQIVSTMGWFTIPGTCFASFLLLGFLEIGQEIENPFNYDENDLDMDAFCLSIQRELHEITAHPYLDLHSFVFSTENQPFAPGDFRNATEILSDVSHEYHKHEHGMASIARTLLMSWRTVEATTKE
ncbi:UPF0187-domain-containing protein [Hysterangium stoloniferum]|nr:UPF0187-domain-containing protein [Hysterangium stoloniferum]